MALTFNPFTGTFDEVADVSDKVVGPASATDNAVARYDGTTGKVIQDSGVTIDDSDNVVIPGNLTVSGTTTFIDTTNLNVTDANISVNSGGNDASAEGAGLTVDRTSTDGSLIFDSALASKWKLGLVGSEVQVADVSSAQTLTNKTINASSNTLTNITNSSIDAAAAIDASKLSNGIVSNAEFDRLDGVSSNIQTQLNGKQSTTLTNAHILVGNVSNVATDVAVTGDITISNAGITDISAGAIVNADVNAAAAIAYSKLAALTSAHILVGSAGNVATDTAVTGDVTISNTGVTDITAGSIVNADVNAAAAIAFSKLASLTNAHILVGSAGNVATDVAVTGDISISNAGVTDITAGSIVNADINAAAAVAFSKLAPLTSAHILVGSAGNVATDVAVTGDVTISNAGVTDISAGAIVNADVNAAAAIAFSKLASLTSAHILVGSAGNVATDVAVTGDVTISNAGVTAIGANKVANSQLAQMAQSTIKGRAAGAGTGDPVDLSATQATAILNNFVGDSGSGGTKGLVPAPTTGDATKYLKGDGTWATVATGTALAVNNLTTGTTITNAYDVITANATSAAFTITLFTASGNTGKLLRFKKTDITSNAITIDANSTETIGGYLTVQLEDYGQELAIISDGTNWLIALHEPVSVIVSHSLASGGGDGGTFTSGSFQTRTLNTIAASSTGSSPAWLSLSSNQVTLSPGFYRMYGCGQSYRVDNNQMRIQNVTDASLVSAGNPTVSDSAGATSVLAVTVPGYLAITASKAFELQHRCSVTHATNGFGPSTAFGIANIFAYIEITKYA